jgi:hypothetical protein
LATRRGTLGDEDDDEIVRSGVKIHISIALCTA